MFKVEISCDRAAERRRPDPVVAGAGVFAQLAPEDLSPAEAARPAAAQARARRPRRLWLAGDVLRYATMLYARFTNPFRPAPQRKR